MIKEHKKGATDNVTKRTHERVSLGKNQGIFLSKREVKLQDNPNISSNKEEEIRELPLGCLQSSL